MRRDGTYGRGGSALREPISDYGDAVARLAFASITLHPKAYVACRELIADIFWMNDAQVAKDVWKARRELGVL
jgi:hypothetical protein